MSGEASLVPLPPVLQVVGFKNSGKTTVVCGLVARLRACGYRVGTAKHHAHETELDQPGKDTWRHRDAGAELTAIATPGRSAVWESGERSLAELVERMRGVDVVVAEGFKAADYPKWVLLRDPADLPLLERVSRPIGVSAWFSLTHPSLPVLPLDDYEGMMGVFLPILGLQGNGASD